MRLYTASVLIPLLGVICLNYGIDAGGIGSRSTIERLGQVQAANTLVVSPLELERRPLVRSRLLHAGTCPDVLVLGSSTVGKLAEGMFRDMRVRNAYVGGPTIEDFESIAAILRRVS